MKVRRYVEPSANEDIIYQNVCAASPIVLGGYFMTSYVCIKEEKTGRKLRVK